MIKTYTAAEASEVLHVSVQTVIRYIRHGRLRASRIGKNYLIEAGDLESFIRSAEVEPDKPQAGSDKEEESHV